MLTSLLDLNIQSLFTGINIPVNLSIENKRVISLADRTGLVKPILNINYPYYKEIKTTLITESIYFKHLTDNLLIQFKPEMGEIQEIKSTYNEVTLFFFPKDSLYNIRNDNAYINYINLSHQLIKLSYAIDITTYIGIVSGDNLFSELMFQLGVLQQLKCRHAFIFIINHSVDVCDYSSIFNAVANTNVKVILLSSKPMFGFNLQKLIQADGQTVVDKSECILGIQQERVPFININCTLNLSISLYSILIYAYLSVLEYQNLKK